MSSSSPPRVDDGAVRHLHGSAAAAGSLEARCLDAAGTGVIVCSNDGAIRHASAAAGALLDFDPAWAPGCGLSWLASLLTGCVDHQERPIRFDDFIMAAEPGGDPSLVGVIIAAGGGLSTRRWIKVSRSPVVVSPGDEQGFVVTLVDVTESEQAPRVAATVTRDVDAA
jgi:PAS domain-containing protein